MAATLVYTNVPGGEAAAPFGGRTVVINGIPWRATNWAPELNTRKIRRNNTKGDQAEVMHRSEPTTQSGLVLQIPLALTEPPKPTGTFVVDGETYVITKSVKAEPEGDWWTATLDYETA